MPQVFLAVALTVLAAVEGEELMMLTEEEPSVLSSLPLAVKSRRSLLASQQQKRAPQEARSGGADVRLREATAAVRNRPAILPLLPHLLG